MRPSVALALALWLPLLGCRAQASASAPVDAGDAAASDAGVAADVDAAPPCSKPYPAGPYGTSVGSVLEDYAWAAGLRVDGTGGAVSLSDALDACAAEPMVLAIRVGTTWCGTCQWYAENSQVLAASDVGPRVRFFDVLVRGVDNVPATPADATLWRALQDRPVEIALNPAFETEPLLPARTGLPVFLLIDAQTMKILDSLSMPTEDTLEDHVRSALAQLDGAPKPAVPAPMLVDGRFSRDQWGMITGMSLHNPPPADPTDMFADNLGAGALGSLIFFDPSLSPSQMVACGSCHETARQFTDGRPTSPEGVGPVPRNAPSVVLAPYQPWQFWDGRIDTLWGQALMPMENPNEFGSSRLFVAHAIFDLYKTPYESLFGPLPPLGDTSRFPPSGMPGDASWKAMTAADQDAVTQVFVNIGKSLEAYERSLRGTPILLDQYAGGDFNALTVPQKDGLLAYFQAGCPVCHWGPRLTDDAFHVLRFPTGRQNHMPDLGRSAGMPEYLANAFTAGSKYSDAPELARAVPVAGAWTVGSFKTPSLRNVALTSPYGHGGGFVTLTDTVDLHRTGGLPAGNAFTTGTFDPWVAPFDVSLEAPIVAFLDTLAMQFAH